jgi:hypothetical protein
MNDQEFQEKVEELRNDPVIAPLLQKLLAKTHKNIFSPEFCERWIKVGLQRDGNEIKIQWETTKSEEFLYSILISVTEIGYLSSEGLGAQRRFPVHQGDGYVIGQLEEGCAYYFLLHFWADGNTNDSIEITFHLQVPLSADNRRLLAKANHLETHPEDEITRRAESYLNKRDRIDTVLAAGIARIKNKNLSSDEEERRIEDFKEDLKWMTEDILK